MIRLRRTFSALKQQEDGAAAVEMVLALPVVLSLIVGTLEIANYYFVASALEHAVLKASRFGITGNETEGVSRDEVVREMIATQTFGRVDMDAVEINTLVYENFEDIGEPEPYLDENANEVYDEGEPFTDINGNGEWDEDVGTVGLGNAGDIVLYRVQYSVDSLTGMMPWIAKALPAEAAVAVRNEPY